MAKLAINKSSLKHQRDQLGLFQRFLPSLDLKRQQLLTEQKKAQNRILRDKIADRQEDEPTAEQQEQIAAERWEQQQAYEQPTGRHLV